MREYHCQPLEPRRLLSTVPIFSETFDGTISDWKIASANQNIQWGGEPSGFGGETAHSGQKMVYSVGIGYDGTSQSPTVPSGTDDVLYHSIDLTNYPNAYLSFWYNIPSIDNGQLQVAVSTGSFSPATVFKTISTATDGWTQAWVNLSSMAGAQRYLDFYYSGSGGTGVFVDDIQVYSNTHDESVPPTASLTGNISDITTAQSTPITFQVHYSDNVAIEPALFSQNNILVLINDSPEATAQFESMQTNPDGSLDATYSFVPNTGQWDGSTDGIYTLQLQSSTVFDTSNNSIAQTILGSFSCAIPIAFDTVAYTSSNTNASGSAGAKLPQLKFVLAGGLAVNDLSYTADIYIAAAPTISASNPGELIGQMPFNYSIALTTGAEVDLDPSTAGLRIPSDLSPGTYSIGVHINPPSDFPDTNDANNWIVTGQVTVRAVANDPTIVTVMVLYTQQTASALGGSSGVLQKINNAITTTNNAFLNSNLNVQLQLAYAGEINYAESGDPTTDLTRLQTPGDGFLDQAQTLRNLYSADLVSLWTATTNTDYIGEAYIAGSAMDSELGYSVVVATQMDAYTFAHEIGHNFGAGHAVGDSNGDNSDNGLYSYSHGYRFTDPSDSTNQLHDIMAYPPGTTIPYYSSPNIDYLGVPTGTSSADNARTISQDAAFVAAYRTPPSIVSITPSAATIGLKGTSHIVANGVTYGSDRNKLQVTFYLDSAGTGVYSPTDTILGVDKSTSGGWKLTAKAKKLPIGNNTIFAIATDSIGQSSAPVQCTIDVVDQPPTIKKLTAKVSHKGFANLQAAAKDPDGPVTQTVIWIDTNNNGILDPGEQSFTGKGSVHGRFTVESGITYTLLAIAYDSNNLPSDIRQIQFDG
ncbi:MAG TPA: M12 family metallo-peptidase [Tepidisphaeraceae bacterium]|nr:M12 family metallo-peptidase [Tepidisphaeraceae bacterium]